ncbi:MAG: ThiF family adenylyltransferase [Proteobacteria bacterium]|jgi:molybdopterin-synthase adenylyltransferase|nr:ThiF family adenylyltransferase [Pseudomonadota bacterium]
MMKLVIVGVGALGSHFLLFSRNFKVSFTVVDFDRVESKNTLSQFHSRMGMGRNKALALQQAMRGLFGLRLKAVPHRLTQDNVAQLLGEADMVVECVDNQETRLIIEAFVKEQEIPCLHGALAADGAYARVMWSEMFTADSGGEGQATCEDGEHLPFISWVSAQMAAAVQVFITDGTKRSCHLLPGQVLPL